MNEFDEYLATKAQPTNEFEAYLASKGAGEKPPPLVPPGPGPWAEGYEPDPNAVKRDRIQRETEAGQTQPPGLLSKLAAAANVFHKDEQAPWYVGESRSPSLGTRTLAFLEGKKPQELIDRQRQVEEQAANDPEFVEKFGHPFDTARTNEGVRRELEGIAAGGLAGEAVGGLKALQAVPRIAPMIADAVGGLVGSFTAGHDVKDLPQDAALATGVGSGFRALGQLSGVGADAIKNAPNKTGEDIRILEKHGYEPSPRPGKPVTSTEPAVYGPPAPESPSQALRAEASSEGRGIVGERGASKMKDELDVRERFRQQKLSAALDRQRQPGGQMGRQVSVESLIPRLQAEMDRPSAKILGINERLKKAMDALQSRVEPSDPMSKHIPAAGEPVRPAPQVDLAPLDDYAGVTRRRSSGQPQFPEQVGKVGQVDELLKNPYTLDTGRGKVTVDRLERPGNTFTRQGSAEGGEEFRVPMGDIRGRTGTAPNHVLTVDEANELRRALDEVSNIAKQSGVQMKDIPGQDLANELRQLVRREAPAVGQANRASSAVQRKTEVMQERMKADAAPVPENFAMQLAGQGEAGSKVTGVRKARLQETQRQFPTNDRLNRGQVDYAFDAPKLLLAEERMKLKKLPRIGGGGGDAMNLSEPLVARGLYRLLRSGQGLKGIAPGAAAAAASESPDDRKGTAKTLGGLGLAGLGLPLAGYAALKRLLSGEGRQ